MGAGPRAARHRGELGIVVSDPDEAVEKIKPYVDLGFTHLVFHAPGDDQPRFLDAFAEQLAPRLRDL